MKYNDFFNCDNTITFFSSVELQSTEPKEMGINQILNISNSELSEFGKVVLSDDIPQGLKEMLLRISWGIRSYIGFQDIFDYKISLNYDDNKQDAEIYARQICNFNANYCYFESIGYLKEAFVCLLNGHLLATITLLRPFFELSIANIYWTLKSNKESSSEFYRWLLGDKTYKQSFSRMVDFYFASCDSLKLLNKTGLDENKKSIKKIYQRLCAYNHTPTLDESFISCVGNNGSINHDFFVKLIDLIDEMLLRINFIYLINYPMTLFPQDIYRHFGYYGGPVGLFFDEFNYSIIKKYYGEEEIMLLKRAFENYSIKDDLISFIESYPKLNDEEMEQSWQEFVSETFNNREDYRKIKDHAVRVTLCKTRFRGFRISTSYIKDVDLEKINTQKN